MIFSFFKLRFEHFNNTFIQLWYLAMPFIRVVNLCVVSANSYYQKLDQESITYCLLNDVGDSHYVTTKKGWSVEDIEVWSLNNFRNFKKKSKLKYE